jgi:hypothetical protein
MIEGPWEVAFPYVRTLRGPRGPYGGAGLEVAHVGGHGTPQEREAVCHAIAALPDVVAMLEGQVRLCVCRCEESWTSRDMHDPACVGDLGAEARRVLALLRGGR